MMYVNLLLTWTWSGYDVHLGQHVMAGIIHFYLECIMYFIRTCVHTVYISMSDLYVTAYLHLKIQNI